MTLRAQAESVLGALLSSELLVSQAIDKLQAACDAGEAKRYAWLVSDAEKLRLKLHFEVKRMRQQLAELTPKAEPGRPIEGLADVLIAHVEHKKP